MKYSKWEEKNEIKKILTKISLKDPLKKSGIIMLEENGNLYIDNSEGHSLVIGATGSGKTQTTILPVMRLAMKSEENVIVHDVCGELYKKCATNFEKQGYNVIVIDFADAIYGNAWNPLFFPYQLYKEKNKDRGIQYIEKLSYYLVKEERHMKNIDPFWDNSAIDLFTGVTLYMFDTLSIDDLNIKNIYNNISKLTDDDYCTSFLKKLDTNSPAYTYLCGILASASDTRKSVISVLLQKLKPFVAYTNLSDMMKQSDFDITQISNTKTVVFIITGNNKYSMHLTPLFIDQCISAAELFGNKEKRLNLLLDEFDNMIPIQNFANVITFARSINVRLTVIIKSFTDLINMYGKTDSEIIKLCFSNIIYLLSNDFYTLEEISKLCGMQSKDTPLISVNELKTMNIFEAIIIIPRHMPFKTNLIPDYKINFGYEDINKDLPLRK